MFFKNHSPVAQLVERVAVRRSAGAEQKSAASTGNRR